MTAVSRSVVSSKANKGERTRERILEAALALFREKGFDKTTMRDIAKAAGMSLGAAYYYFGSKEALVLAYYEQVVAIRTERAHRAFDKTSDVSERIRAVYKLHFDVARRDRKLLGALVRSVADPDSDVSVFSAATREVRNANIQLFREALAVDAIPESLRDLGSLGLWTLDLGLMLYFIWDQSPRQRKTRQLVDDAVDTLMPMLPFLSLSMAEPMVARVAKLLLDAGLVPDDD